MIPNIIATTTPAETTGVARPTAVAVAEGAEDVLVEDVCGVKEVTEVVWLEVELVFLVVVDIFVAEDEVSEEVLEVEVTDR
jgi:hypothetical protein